MSLLHQSDDAIEKAARDLRNRTQGLLAELAGMVSAEEAPDWVLEERVRANIGRVSRHPGAIEVRAQQGAVTLQGPVLKEEVDQVLENVSRVRGVKAVENMLEVHDSPGNIPSLQGASAPREPRPELLQENWSPTARLMTALGGGVLVLYGMSRRGLIGAMMSLTGLGLAARGVTNLQFKRLVGTGSSRRAIDLQKAININAPVEKVYQFWSDYTNFPRFMAHVREIKLNPDGTSTWTVSGPAGIPVEFRAETTQQIPDQVIAWKTVPGETVKSAGLVQFHPNPDGNTRVTVRMSYNPIVGAIGHAVASLFGADPKQAMDEDLVRMKSLLETGKASAPGKQEITKRRTTKSSESPGLAG
jgi:uncharacterized membrane protein